MRKLLALSALALTSACAHLPPLVSATPAQAVPSDPRSATAEVGQVRLTVRPDRWRGWPSDLNKYVTPVEVLIENGSAKELAVRHTHFSLLLPNGFRYDALSGAEIRRFADTVYGAGGGHWYYGAYGVYPWPGLFMPWPGYYPYLWWGDPWWGDPWYGAPPPPPPPRGLNPTPSGKLIPGGRVAILVFFPVPADAVPACTFEAQVIATDGTELGTARMPFERRTVGRGVPVRASPVQPAPAPAAPAKGGEPAK